MPPTSSLNTARDDPDSLAELLMIADPTAYKTLFLLAERQTEEVLPLLEAELAKSRPRPPVMMRLV